MIHGTCGCGSATALPGSAIGEKLSCDDCGAGLTIVGMAEAGEDIIASGRLVVAQGPAEQGRQFLLAGDHPIEVGKSDGKAIRLPGTRVSRNHCRFVRDGDGWRVEDAGSTNGIQVNGAKVSAHRLAEGDRLGVGEYELHFGEKVSVGVGSPAKVEEGEDNWLASLGEVSTALESAPRVAPPPIPAGADGTLAFKDEGPMKGRRPGTAIGAKSNVPMDGPTCPSCKNRLARNAKICVGCGIDVKTGKALVTSKALDENDLAIRCDTWIRLVSWLVPVGLYPVASEAFGFRKPLVVWTMAAVTIVASVLFMVGVRSDSGYEQFKNLMLWTGRPAVAVTDATIDKATDRAMAEILEEEDIKPDSAEAKKIRERIRPDVAAEMREYQPGEYSSTQLVTNAFLHDPGSIYGFLMHLGGNLLIILVLGSGVNSLVGNVKMSFIYPGLAIAASLAMLAAHSHEKASACLGASGIAMGLAGMYLVFFPIHTVYVAGWIRVRWHCGYKVWPMRGFWVVGIAIGLDILAVVLNSKDGVGHWAHIGGFATGFVLASVLLFTRLVDAGGGDLFSALLGKGAWALIGSPESRSKRLMKA